MNDTIHILPKKNNKTFISCVILWVVETYFTFLWVLHSIIRGDFSLLFNNQQYEKLFRWRKVSWFGLGTFFQFMQMFLMVVFILRIEKSTTRLIYFELVYKNRSLVRTSYLLHQWILDEKGAESTCMSLIDDMNQFK